MVDDIQFIIQKTYCLYYRIRHIFYIALEIKPLSKYIDVGVNIQPVVKCALKAFEYDIRRYFVEIVVTEITDNIVDFCREVEIFCET